MRGESPGPVRFVNHVPGLHNVAPDFLVRNAGLKTRIPPLYNFWRSRCLYFLVPGRSQPVSN